MKTFVQQFIEDHYFENEEFVILAVSCRAGQGVPEVLTKMAHPVAMHMIPNRPLNVQFSENSVSMDLCFDAPPVTCTFNWDDIIAIGTDVDSMVPVTCGVVLVRLHDDKSLLGDIELDGNGIWDIKFKKHEESGLTGPVFSLIPGGKDG